LRGLFELEPVAAVPRRRRAAGVPPALVGLVPAGERALRARRGGRGGPGRDRLGAGLPAPAGTGAAPAGTPGPADRVLPAHPVPAGRAVHATAPPRRRAARAARRGSRRLPAPARRAELRPARPA